MDLVPVDFLYRRSFHGTGGSEHGAKRNHVIHIEVATVLRVDDFWPEAVHFVFDHFDNIEQVHRIETVIRKLCERHLLCPEELPDLLRLRVQLFKFFGIRIIGIGKARGHTFTENENRDRMPLRCEFCNGASAAKHFVIRMSRNNKDIHSEEEEGCMVTSIESESPSNVAFLNSRRNP